MVDALVSGASVERRASSTLVPGTKSALQNSEGLIFLQKYRDVKKMIIFAAYFWKFTFEPTS